MRPPTARRRAAVLGERVAGGLTRQAPQVARSIPVPVAIVVAVWFPGVWTAAATGLLILAYLLTLDLLTTRDRSGAAVATAAATLGTAVAATALVTAVFALPPVPAWPLVLVGLAATALAYTLATRHGPAE